MGRWVVLGAGGHFHLKPDLVLVKLNRVEVDFDRIRVLPRILDSRQVAHFAESHGALLTLSFSPFFDGLKAISFLLFFLVQLLDLLNAIVARLIYSGETGFYSIHCVTPALFLLIIFQNNNSFFISC